MERREGWERLRTHQDVASQVPRVKGETVSLETELSYSASSHLL